MVYCHNLLLYDFEEISLKIPSQEKDNSFRLYCMYDDNFHDYYLSNECHKLLLQQRKLKNTIVRLNKRKKQLEEEKGDKPEEDEEMKDADSAPQQHHHSHDVELGKLVDLRLAKTSQMKLLPF